MDEAHVGAAGLLLGLLSVRIHELGQVDVARGVTLDEQTRGLGEPEQVVVLEEHDHAVPRQGPAGHVPRVMLVHRAHGTVATLGALTATGSSTQLGGAGLVEGPVPSVARRPR